MRIPMVKFFLCLLFISISSVGDVQAAISPEQAREIAKEAYIYGNPMVDNYRIQYAYFVDTQSPEYKTSWNQIFNMARVFTSDDKAIQTANSDTPYSFVGMDLRTEPLILTLPPIEKNRYFSLQFIDWYTHNFAYAGSRTTGNDGSVLLVAGPDWQGETPKGVAKMMRSETQFVFLAYRTQLFNPADIDNVKAVQAGYKVQTLSAYMGKPTPKAASKINWMPPLSAVEQKTSLEFFNILNFVLEFTPTVPSEKALMARFAKIGVGGGKRINFESLSPEMKQAFADGIVDGWKALDNLEKTDIASGKVTTADLFGTREVLKNNYLYRFAGAVLGIYGNSKDDAIYPLYREDADGQPLDASKHDYTLRFEPGQYPPVNAFWSVTMYNLPESLMVANPINRYLINSPMLPELKKDADGGLTIYVQKDSPGKDKEANWLPAPDGPFWIPMRIYWPKIEALDGTWKAPPLNKVQ
ncbi:DUF1254 domain-containing protein [Shewanella glacialipiscicola]|uniref:Cell envelope protein n=1 Tax=Shewanella glacialipiscicola TaxID=614069 RepID=A0ABQ6J4Q7_9GAMM|nr:DUF1254 domain-containing protein [Shewanella glacialipiscicola]MCL1086853.1 DUF1254 domain-containing protein [Shewanella glacialipiscicola]GIU08375.1 hypothetical protein TUM4636_12950 [Shewanella glacialipiscicola]GMA83112.1 hypothetical protein GCM10025855_26450 [Shewanella glacialipiscicola]